MDTTIKAGIDAANLHLKKFCTKLQKYKKWADFFVQSDNADDRNKQNRKIRFKTSMLQSDLCDYSHGNFVAEGKITIKARNNIDRKNRSLAFGNSVQFICCISKINNVLIDNDRCSM